MNLRKASRANLIREIQYLRRELRDKDFIRDAASWLLRKMESEKKRTKEPSHE